mmetsp:Transcript_47695/g.111242  ORF Transcript_47695/g.111242 Transcript_47695/m.111242 type:complete len:363 (+) Transcript_47695:48-1136(+)
MAKEALATLTVFTVAAILLTSGSLSFVVGGAPQQRPGQHEQTLVTLETPSLNAGLQSTSASLLGFGAAFGLAFAALRSSTGAGRTALRAEAKAEGAEIAVAEKSAGSAVLPYMENIPRSIVEKEALEGVLAMTPREQWEDPPEDSVLYTLKVYAETYGEGKATKMPWWDWLYMRFELPDANEVSPEKIKLMQDDEKIMRRMMEGKIPLYVPILGVPIYTGMTLDWKPEQELFAGDQIRSPISDSRFAKNFIGNTAFYREGLENWQRGLEIGMAHGYFLVGPFTSLGPLRNTPEAATVGVLSAAAVIGIVSVGGLLFGATVKPRAFDKDGESPGSGFTEIINWHAVGGLGGAGFAHLLLTLFG